MATIPSVQLFRNSIIITGRTEAIKALDKQKASVADGGLILARYSDDGTDNGVKTLLGIVRNGGGTNVQLTVIDVEGAAANVQKAITSAITSLDKVDTEVDGQYVASVSEEDGIITVSRQALPSLGKQTSSGKAITAITQTKGLVSVEFGGVAAANVSVADASNKFTATTVEDVLVEIQNSLDAAIGSGGSVGTQISNAISGISGTTTITDGKVITAISQTDGKVSVSASTIGADKVSASTIASSTTTVAVTGTKVSEQIASLATSIKTVESGKTYTISAVTSSEANVKEAFALVDGSGTQAGATIKIYKDSSLKSVALNGQMLNFTYILADGTEQTVGVDVSTFLAESEFKDGLKVDNGLVKVKIDTTSEDSEDFLTVSESGVKLSGVQTAINTAAAAATTKVEKTSEGSHIEVASAKSEDDGSVTYTISESDIASANALTAERNARESADTALSNRLGDGVTSELTATAQFTALKGKIEAETTARTNADDELSKRLGNGVTTAATATAQLQALSGTSESLSGDTSVNGAKKYTEGKIAAISATIVSTSGTSTTEAIKIIQTNGKIESITLGAFDCGTY